MLKVGTDMGGVPILKKTDSLLLRYLKDKIISARKIHRIKENVQGKGTEHGEAQR